MFQTRRYVIYKHKNLSVSIKLILKLSESSIPTPVNAWTNLYICLSLVQINLEMGVTIYNEVKGPES